MVSEKNKLKNTAANISYPASSAAVVFGVYLSAQAAFRFDRKSPAIGNVSYCRLLPPGKNDRQCGD